MRQLIPIEPHRAVALAATPPPTPTVDRHGPSYKATGQIGPLTPDADMAAGYSLATFCAPPAQRDIDAAIAELQAVLRPTPPEQAAILVARLVGGYPKCTADDPEIYTLTMTEHLSAYPVWAIREATRSVHHESKFLPSVAEMIERLDKLVRTRRWQLRHAKRLRAARQAMDADPKLRQACEGGERLVKSLPRAKPKREPSR